MYNSAWLVDYFKFLAQHCFLEASAHSTTLTRTADPLNLLQVTHASCENIDTSPIPRLNFVEGQWSQCYQGSTGYPFVVDGSNMELCCPRCIVKTCTRVVGCSQS